MTRTGLGPAIGLVAATALACTPPGLPCTEIGAQSGVAVTVTRELAPTITRLRLQVCFGGRCRLVPVQLAPGLRALPQDCPTDAPPDTACSASAVPDGTLVGFADVPDLPVGEVDVTATMTRGPRILTYDQIRVQATTVFPNGRQCPGEANQARLRVTPMGLVG